MTSTPRQEFLQSLFCKARAHCVDCLSNPAFRQSAAQLYQFPDDQRPGVCMDPQARVTLEEAMLAQARWARTLPPELRGEAPLPSLLERAGHLAGAAGRLVKALVNRQSLEVADSVYRMRLAMCHGCPSHQYRDSDQTCAICGCPVERKAEVATEFCDLHYWPALNQRSTKVLTASLWCLEQEALLAVLPGEGRAADALRQQRSKAGECRGCRQRKLQQEALQAFADEAPAWPEEVRRAVRQVFQTYDYVFLNSDHIPPLDQLLGTTFKA
jgi:hypothetical protein